MREIIISPDFFEQEPVKKMGEKHLVWYIKLSQRADDNGVVIPNETKTYEYLEMLGAVKCVVVGGNKFYVLFWYEAKPQKKPILFIPQDEVDEIIEREKFHRKGSKKRKLRAAIKKVEHLFKDSEYYDVVNFIKAFSDDELYKQCDLPYYHARIKNWSESKNVKLISWIAQARNFMLSDANNNKLKLNKNTTINDEQSTHSKPIWR